MLYIVVYKYIGNKQHKIREHNKKTRKTGKKQKGNSKGTGRKAKKKATVWQATVKIEGNSKGNINSKETSKATA
jgi:hypothetical protein